MFGGGSLVQAGVAKQSAAAVTHITDVRATCVEVVLLWFLVVFLTAASHYKNAIMFYLCCISLWWVTKLSTTPLLIQKTEVPEHQVTSMS